MNQRFMTCLLAVVLAHTLTAAAADRPTLTAVIMDLNAGDDIQVVLPDGRCVQGAWVRFEAADLVIATPAESERVPRTQVRALLVRSPSTWQGARVGAAIGGVGLGLYGVLLGSVIAADDDGGAAVALGLVGALGGALGGGVTGGLVGAALPRWRLVWGETVGGLDSPEPRPPGSRGGGLAVGTGWSEALGGRDTGGLVWQALLLVRTGRGFQHGLEFMAARPGEARQQDFGRPAFTGRHPTRLWHVGWRGEVPLRRVEPGTLTPFVSGGVATYFWQDTYLGASLGGGLRVEPAADGVGLLLEVRRHDNLQNLTETDPSHWTATAAAIYRW